MCAAGMPLQLRCFVMICVGRIAMHSASVAFVYIQTSAICLVRGAPKDAVRIFLFTLYAWEAACTGRQLMMFALVLNATSHLHCIIPRTSSRAHRWHGCLACVTQALFLGCCVPLARSERTTSVALMFLIS